MNKTTALFLFGCMTATATGLLAQTATTSTPAPAAPAAAPAAPAAPSLSIVFTPSFVSQYMFRGSRLGGEAFEPSIEADYGNWAVGVWSNIPIANKVPGQSDPEIDPYGSYTYSINDSFSLQPGFTWYNYPSAPQDQGFYKMTFEPNFAVNYSIGNLKLTPKIYYDLVLKGPTYEFNAAYTVPLKDLNSEIDLAGTVGTFIQNDVAYHATPEVKNWGDYWLVGASMPFTITKASKLTVGIAYTKGSNNYFKQDSFPKSVNTAAVGRGVLTVSYAWTFRF